MKGNRVAAKAVQVAIVSLIILLFAACGGPKDVQIWVDGPWAIVEYEGRLLLIAPPAAASLHATPAVPLTEGFYDLTANSKIDINNVLPPKNPNSRVDQFPREEYVTKQELQDLLKSSAEHYVVSLPMPESFEPAMVAHSKVGSKWWPDCHDPSCFKENVFTTQLVLHYRVSRLDGFILDNARQSFQDNQPMIRISMVPWSYMASTGHSDPCDIGGRRAFNNLVGMFPSLDQKLFVDLMVKENDGSMGPYPSEKDEHYCLVGDAQNPYWHHFHWPWPWPWPEAILDSVRQVIVHGAPKTKEIEQAWQATQALLTERYKSEYGEQSDTYKEKQDQLAKAAAAFDGKGEAQKGLEALEAISGDLGLGKSHSRNNGSGACRNPILLLQAN